MYGKAGADLVLRVPPGTQVFDEERGKQIGDLSEHGQRLIIARGGRGGRGNITSPRRPTAPPAGPNRARPGRNAGRLELKLLADCGSAGVSQCGEVVADRPRLGCPPQDRRLSRSPRWCRTWAWCG
jgi:GTP-binding protein